MSEQVGERKLMSLAMSNKTFMVTYKQDPLHRFASKNMSKHTGTLELEGSFAVIRDWRGSELIGIKVITADQIESIEWIPTEEASVIKMNPDGSRA